MFVSELSGYKFGLSRWFIKTLKGIMIDRWSRSILKIHIVPSAKGKGK